MTDEIMKVINDNVYGVWFLIGAALVFWMQAGFAMVEAGFTRAKNSGNIIMKNLMDFCIGTVMWFLIGASLMLPAAEGKSDILGILGTPGFGVFTDYANFSYSGFVFNLVFCNNSNHRIRCDGRKNKIRNVLYLFGRHFRYHLSD